MSSSELDDEPLEALVRRFEREISGDEEPFIDHDDIALAMSKRGPHGQIALLKFLGDRDERRLRAAIFGLSVSPAGMVLYAHDTLPFLDDARSTVVMEVVYGLARARVKGCAEKVLPLTTHPSQFVRGAVLAYAASVDEGDGYERAIAGLSDPAYIVREVAADVLSELDRPEAIDSIRPLLVDDHADVRAAARSAIESLTRV
jgi:hypothetical protein